MQIVIVLYDRFTALDAVGPYQVFSSLPGAEGENAGIVGNIPLSVGHEHGRGARQSDEHLEGAHRVEGGEPVVENDGDLHGCP